MIAAYPQHDNDPTDATPRRRGSRFTYHAAGANGSGSSSYLDDTILRDQPVKEDHNTAWATASDGTLERRDFHCQNWRADVIALVEPDADIVEHVRYGLSGEPFAISPADVTYAATNPSSGLGVPNGVVDTGGDYSHYLNMYTAGTDPRADFNHDGTIDSGDFFAYLGKHTADTGQIGGRGVLSGIYRHGVPRDSRAAGHFAWFVEAYLEARSPGVVEAVAKAADGLELSPLQVSLAWVRDAPGVTAPLLGARNQQQLEQCLSTVGVTLPDAIVSALDDVSGGPAAGRTPELDDAS